MRLRCPESQQQRHEAEAHGLQVRRLCPASEVQRSLVQRVRAVGIRRRDVAGAQVGVAARQQQLPHHGDVAEPHGAMQRRVAF